MPHASPYATALHDGLGYLVAAVLFGAFLLLRLCGKAAHPSILRATTAFGICVIGLLVSDLLVVQGARSAATYLRWISVFGEGLSILRLVAIGLFWVLLPAARVRPPRIAEDVTLGALAVVWVFIWLRENQVNVTGIVATSAVVTAVIAFSLQDTLGNVLGGMALQMDRSVCVGDWIKLDDLTGRVREVGWRHTAIETNNWETVVIPNSVLVKNRFVVLGRRQDQPVQWRRTITFRVDYRYPPTRVMEAVRYALGRAEIPHVSRKPAPNCVLLDFDESCGVYAVRYWLTEMLWPDITDSEIRTHVYFALQREGIPLSIPAQAVFVTHDTAERKSLKEEAAFQRRVTALLDVDLFHSLEPAELEAVARRLQPAPFTAGDVMTRQGAEALYLYILVSGHADVTVTGADGRQSRVTELGPGSFFGEMALMTGEPRQATVTARTDVECFRLDKESFEEVIRQRPAMAEEISRVLARRRTQLDAVLEGLDARARDARLSDAQADILGRIRRLFGLSE